MSGYQTSGIPRPCASECRDDTYWNKLEYQLNLGLQKATGIDPGNISSRKHHDGRGIYVAHTASLLIAPLRGTKLLT